MLRTVILLAFLGLAAAGGTCDESKCRSPALVNLLGVPGYDCWAKPEAGEQYTCATGLTGFPVQSIPKVDGYSYYTCCAQGAAAAGPRCPASLFVSPQSTRVCAHDDRLSPPQHP